MTADHTSAPSDHYEVVVVGAGIAGLNALAVASGYLGPHDRVLLVDRRHRVGGMWVDTYPYVRLHQPHPFFTAGDIPWTLGEGRAYLATKWEVLDHFSHCIAELRHRVRLDQWLETEYVGHEVVDGTVRVTCRGAEGRERVASAERFVKATSLEIMPNRPFPVSSEQVQSVTPESDVREGEIARSTAPVWIVGGGKTAMDTARAIITAQPGREVNMLAGSGTFFLERDRAFPTGHRRWWGGQRGYPYFRDWSMRFDGTNEREVMRWVSDHPSTISITPRPRDFLFGQLSRSEATTISAGLRQVVTDHLVDVVDEGGRPHLELRSGARRAIEPGSWLVNCSGHFFRGEQQPYAPYTSAGGRVATVTPRSTIALLASFSGYFITHLLMLGKLDELPLYEVDADTLGRRDRDAWACTVVAVHMHNLSVMIDALPRTVFARNGLDFEKWFPLHRQLLTSVQVMREHGALIEHTAAALDRVREVHGVRCGPLPELAAAR
ncbi:FAD-dependent oxidoreductase [Nocardioides aestuarii]|uniref:FAD-dependent oxidoreductase n=1 Tax=Nocardioides aestuarii TaxID=252231 RepID=A0ABW4TPB5_9ACTN